MHAPAGSVVPARSQYSDRPTGAEYSRISTLAVRAMATAGSSRLARERNLLARAPNSTRIVRASVPGASPLDGQRVRHCKPAGRQSVHRGWSRGHRRNAGAAAGPGPEGRGAGLISFGLAPRSRSANLPGFHHRIAEAPARELHAHVQGPEYQRSAPKLLRRTGNRRSDTPLFAAHSGRECMPPRPRRLRPRPLS